MSFESLFSISLNIFHFLVVLGLAVIFHEWGHFIVAKLCGAKVKTFSVGMGRKIFSYTRNETEYTISMLPLGGYVNIAGMSPEDELTGEPWEYLQLAAWKRMLIVLAGPAMNFVLAFLIYFFLFTSLGQSYTATTVVGKAPAGSWGWEMGLREDDRIVSVNGKPVSSWEEITQYQREADTGEVDELTVTVVRGGETLTKSKTVPEYMKDGTMGGEAAPPGIVDGIFVTGVVPGSPAEEAGLKPGTVISAVDGKKFESQKDWSDYLTTRYRETGEGQYEPVPAILSAVSPDGATEEIAVMPDMRMPDPDAVPYRPITQLGIVYTGEITPKEFFAMSYEISPLGILPKLPPVIGGLQEGAPAERAGIEIGSRIVEIDGEPVDNWVTIRTGLQDYVETGPGGEPTAKPLQITWLDPDGEMKTAEVAPMIKETPLYTSTSLKTAKQYPIALLGFDLKTDRLRLGILGGAAAAWQEMVDVTLRMINILTGLFTGNISIKVMGGPIAIFQMSAEHGRWGVEMLFNFIALLSLNLGLINLFPLPPLDGGHLVFYTAEIVRRKKLTMRQLENFGKIGFAIVIPLMLFMIFNDLNRLDFFDWIGKLFQKVF